MNTLAKLFETMSRRTLPTLGKEVGNFDFYDSLLAGQASSVSDGAILGEAEIVKPDSETLSLVSQLQLKEVLTPEEKDFLDYFQLTDQVRTEIIKIIRPK